MAQQAQQQFAASCNKFNTFPQNHMRRSNSFQHTLQSHFDRLDKQESRLFHKENNAELDVWEYIDSKSGYVSTQLSKLSELQNHLRGPPGYVKEDPQARFIFIHAKHSRDALQVTREMLMYAFTYHQVMPFFLDYLFLFGRKYDNRGFHFSGFRHESTLFSKKATMRLPDLGRSGQDYSLCYNLKSVEKTMQSPQIPWSIRQTAVYHSFDVEARKSFWVNVKGNSLIRDRIIAATKPVSRISVEIATSKVNEFVQSLDTHLVLIDWCGEHWRWYIDYLEELSEAKTRRALLTREDALEPRALPLQPQKIHSKPVISNNTFFCIPKSFKQGIFQINRFLSVPLTNLPGVSSATTVSQEIIVEEEVFSFANLQEVQHVEDKTNEVLLMLESNINIITHIKEFYSTTFASPEFPQDLKDDSKIEMTRFTNTICNVVSDLMLQVARAKMLRTQITDRKSLLYGILNYRNVEASKKFAEHARMSTNNMEDMTRQMNALAQRTKQETVSMRIITLVTLFFLPGTFISTIMSTDIIRYNTDPANGTPVKNFSLDALLLYVKVTLPLMALTFTCWFLVYKWVDRRQDKEQKLMEQDCPV